MKEAFPPRASNEPNPVEHDYKQGYATAAGLTKDIVFLLTKLLKDTGPVSKPHNGLHGILRPQDDALFVFNPVAIAFAFYCLFSNPTGCLPMKKLDYIMEKIYHIITVLGNRGVYVAAKGWHVLSEGDVWNPLRRTRSLWDSGVSGDEAEEDASASHSDADADMNEQLRVALEHVDSMMGMLHDDIVMESRHPSVSQPSQSDDLI